MLSKTKNKLKTEGYKNPCMNGGTCFATALKYPNETLNPQVANCGCPKGLFKYAQISYTQPFKMVN